MQSLNTLVRMFTLNGSATEKLYRLATNPNPVREEVEIVLKFEFCLLEYC